MNSSELLIRHIVSNETDEIVKKVLKFLENNPNGLTVKEIKNYIRGLK